LSLPISGMAHQAGGGADFVWFVYGSSLDAGAFRGWAAEHGYTVPDLSRGTPARLPGWRLCFDVASRYWGGAVGSLSEEPGGFVEGLALPLPGSARGLADHKEGAISGLYRPIDLTVLPLRGGAPLGASAYVACDDRRLPAEQRPSPTWLEVVIRGARASGLSEEWLEALQRLRPGPGEERR